MPYRDDSRTTLAFSLAALLHVLLATAVVGFFLLKPAPQPEQNKVFELVAAPPSDAAADEAAAPGPPSLKLPNLSVPNIPTPPQQTPQTPPQPALTPMNQAVPPKPAAKLTHATTAVAKPPSNQPETDYQKFLHEHPLSNSPALPRTAGRPTPSVSINASSIIKNLESAGSGANGQARGHASSASAAEDQNYVDKLRERLKEAFVPPGGITGLSAEVYLVIAPDGQLVEKRISRSSGKAEFDDAVNAALRQLTNVDPPPGGAQVSYYFTYTPDGQ